jgi:hypothetical protein
MGLEIAIAVFVLLAGIAVCYAWLQHNAVHQLNSERAALQASLAQAKSEEITLTARVDALTAAEAQQASRDQAAALAKQQAVVSHKAASEHVARRVAAHRAPADDPRWKQLQEQLGDQQRKLADNQKEVEDNQRQIAETQANLQQAKSELENNLQSARTDLGNGIARNHDELVELEKKGERKYYEFSFQKSKEYHHTGPISIALRKADAKHLYCDLGVLVDDKEISRKHVNLYESVTLIPEGYTQPLQLVINHIEKDAVKGYLSEPKYPPAKQAASAAPTTATASVDPSAVSAADSKLEHREDAAH